MSHWPFLSFISTSKQIQKLHINISPARFYKTIIYIFSCRQQPGFFFKDILYVRHVRCCFCLGHKSTLSLQLVVVLNFPATSESNNSSLKCPTISNSKVFAMTSSIDLPTSSIPWTSLTLIVGITTCVAHKE